MRRLILKMSVSIDGFVAGPNGEVDWMFRSRDEGGMRWVDETLRQAGLHVMGSRTYYDMAAFWPTANHPLAEAMNVIPKAVFTRQPSLDLLAYRKGGESSLRLRAGHHAAEGTGRSTRTCAGGSQAKSEA